MSLPGHHHHDHRAVAVFSHMLQILVHYV